MSIQGPISQSSVAASQVEVPSTIEARVLELETALRDLGKFLNNVDHRSKSHRDRTQELERQLGIIPPPEPEPR